MLRATTCILCTLAALAILPARAEDPAGAVQPQTQEPSSRAMRFSTLDANSDGLISRDEYMDKVDSKAAGELFSALDADKNDKVSRDEVREFHRKRQSEGGNPQ